MNSYRAMGEYGLLLYLYLLYTSDVLFYVEWCIR